MASSFPDQPEQADQLTDLQQGGGNSWYRKMFVGKASAWTAVFTLVLCVFSYLLWQANNIANQTSITTQRAFINFGGTFMEKVFANPQDPKSRITGYRLHAPMQNTGTTATRYTVYEI